MAILPFSDPQRSRSINYLTFKISGWVHNDGNPIFIQVLLFSFRFKYSMILLPMLQSNVGTNIPS